MGKPEISSTDVVGGGGATSGVSGKEMIEERTNRTPFNKCLRFAKTLVKGVLRFHEWYRLKDVEEG